ncbi:hypothetical protein G7078_05980 [Sphingomonas sinipercae]|uniref:Uncharacterized protein n=1 Tax=Sphingomonas sinipercae TaxID=2714944 RepID=A0A6G7ZN69_9SPHN|nr:hypothetical protein [Sphingomonas sinipercae]QIL02383.1 hypothetical protein G7078_05980 [Sphingomonas sinipercae]
MLAHIVIALLIQAAVALPLRNWWAGAAAACAWAIAREVTQAEYRWIERFGAGVRANMPWHGGFDPRVWSADALADWLVPSLVVIAVALLARRRVSSAGR